MRLRPVLGRGGLAAAGLALLVLGGCGGNQTVRGKLVYADTEEPVTELAGFDVTFSSETLGVSARGTIEQDGTFRLGTEKENDGAPPGQYVVTLTQPIREPDRPYLGDPVVDRAYEDPARSDLRAEVTTGKNDFVFKLRRIEKKKKR
jgi:hypothetical protein